MDERGVDRTQLSTLLGISYQAVRKALDLGGAFGTENNLKAADFFGVNPRWLHKGVEPKHLTNGAVSTSLEGATASVAATVKPPLSDEADRLGRLFDLIPETDLIKRAVAYNAASAAIVAVLEGHKPASNAPQAQDQKTQPA